MKKPSAATAKKRPRSDVPFAAPDWPASSVKMRKLSEIHPYAHNAKVHPKAQIDLLAQLMIKHGVDQPIVLDEDGVILKGHGRWMAAAVAKFEVFPTVQHLGLTEAEKIAMRLADNQVSLMGGWNNELVKGEIETLKQRGYDVALLGFGESQLVQFTTSPGPPSAFRAVDESLPTEHECPKCRYRWSGSSASSKPVERKRRSAGK